MRIARGEDWDRPELALKGTTPTGEFRVSHALSPEHPGDIQVYLVRSYSHHAEVGLHFHEHDQFQVFVAGTGTFQRHDIEPFTVHFSDPYSTYGPIVAGDDGLSFFVFRAEEDAGGHYMPGSRDKLVGKPGRNVSAPCPGDVTGSAPVLAAQADGMRADVLRATAGGTITVPAPHHSRGQFALLLDGSGELEGTRIGPWSVLFQTPDEPATDLQVGPDGATLLMLRFPARADA